MKLAAVDNGKSGAIALLHSDTMSLHIEDTKLDNNRELDCGWVFELLSEWEPDAAIIEGCFKNNDLVEMGGEFKAICRLLNIPLTKVAIASWKKNIFGRNHNDKELSVNTCLQLLPNAPLDRPTPKGRKVNLDHNRAEAALLSLYLLRQLN